MTDLLALEFVQTALLASVIIGLLLSYLGVHVVGRGIVFVDLALGQISMPQSLPWMLDSPRLAKRPKDGETTSTGPA